jgi:hypothetical protein
MTPGSRSLPHHSEARSLLVKVMATDGFDAARLARELVVTEARIALYAAGDVAIPLERQLCLARLVIANIPELARRGRNLVGRVQAQMSFSHSETVTHQSAPPPNGRSF